MALGSTGRGPRPLPLLPLGTRATSLHTEWTPTAPACPHGGFPFEAQFDFQDHTSTTAHTTVPCRTERIADAHAEMTSSGYSSSATRAGTRAAGYAATAQIASVTMTTNASSSAGAQTARRALDRKARRTRQVAVERHLPVDPHAAPTIAPTMSGSAIRHDNAQARHRVSPESLTRRRGPALPRSPMPARRPSRRLDASLRSVDIVARAVQPFTHHPAQFRVATLRAETSKPLVDPKRARSHPVDRYAHAGSSLTATSLAASSPKARVRAAPAHRPGSPAKVRTQRGDPEAAGHRGVAPNRPTPP